MRVYYDGVRIPHDMIGIKRVLEAGHKTESDYLQTLTDLMLEGWATYTYDNGYREVLMEIYIYDSLSELEFNSNRLSEWLHLHNESMGGK